MALTERQEVDKVEVVGPYKSVQVRTATVIERDGEELTRSFHRHVIQAGEDYSSETPEVQAICAAVHTAEVIAAYEAHQASMQPEAPAEEPAAEDPAAEESATP